jgi:hypothetical protein
VLAGRTDERALVLARFVTQADPPPATGAGTGTGGTQGGGGTDGGGGGGTPPATEQRREDPDPPAVVAAAPAPTGSAPSTSVPARIGQVPSPLAPRVRAAAARIAAQFAAATRGARARRLVRGVRARVVVPVPGTLRVTVTAGRTVLATGGATFRAAGARLVTLRATARGRRALRPQRSVRGMTVRVRFVPRA